MRGWVEVVAAETLLREDLGGAVVLGPGVLAAGDGGRLADLGLGRQSGSEDRRQGAGEGGSRDEDVVEVDHVGCVLNV